METFLEMIDEIDKEFEYKSKNDKIDKTKVQDDEYVNVVYKKESKHYL